MRPLIFVASLLVVGLSLCLSPRAYGLHSGEFFVYRLEYPAGGASGPPNRICTGYRIMSVEVTTLPDMEAFHVHPGPDPGAGTGMAATHWMAPHSGAFTMPGSHQGDIQIDNPTSTPIAAFAIGVPQSSVAMPVTGYMQPEFGGGGSGGWQSATITRYQWDHNAWTAPNINDPGSPPGSPEEWLPAVGPTNWTPPATGGPGATFEELFGSSPAFDTAILFWAADINNAIAPGSIRTGFALLDGMHGLNDDPLPVVDFSATAIIGVGNLVPIPEIVPEPTTAALVLTVVCGLALCRRRAF